MWSSLSAAFEAKWKRRWTVAEMAPLCDVTAALAAAAWAERQNEHAPEDIERCHEATDLGHTCKVCQAPPIDRPAPYRHYGGQPCHGCQICLDDGEAGDG